MQRIVMVVLMALVIALAVVDYTYKCGPEPDAEYPFTNQKIVWTN